MPEIYEIEDNLIRKDHVLPFVRLKAAELINFKSVQHGKIEFDCGKKYVPYDTKSDILGIYGQNGSGKTAFIEALSILKRLMSGERIPEAYADCISVESEYAELHFVIDLQYPNGEQRDAFYSFKMEKVALTPEELQENTEPVDIDDFVDKNISKKKYRVRIFDEVLKLSWTDTDGIRKNRQRIFDATSVRSVFGPADKRKEIIGTDKKAIRDLMSEKDYCNRRSKSFIFSQRTLERINACNTYSLYYQVILELRHFALFYFYVLDTKSSGYIRLNIFLPVYTTHGFFAFDMRSAQGIPEKYCADIQREIEKISNVLCQLVPGISIALKEIEKTVDEEGELVRKMMLMAKHVDFELPLYCESDGIRKIISELSLIIAAYTQPSATVAIDEFDAGVFEYLLGEILQIIEESGKGQFIFTSHNLRPLEVMDKKFLYFTTTNPNKRYVHLKGIAATNNLRDTYFREIVIGEQTEELYNRTKRFKIVAALRKIAKAEKEEELQFAKALEDATYSTNELGEGVN